MNTLSGAAAVPASSETIAASVSENSSTSPAPARQWRSISEWLQSWPNLGLDADEIQTFKVCLLEYTIKVHITQQTYLRHLAHDLGTAIDHKQLALPADTVSSDSNIVSSCHELLAYIECCSGVLHVGGCALLLRMLRAKTGVSGKYCQRMDALFAQCWEETINPQLDSPSHVAVVCGCKDDQKLQEEFWEWNARFPDRTTLFDFTVEGCLIQQVAGEAELPEKTCLYLLGHGDKHGLLGCHPAVLARELSDHLQSYAYTRLDTIMLDACNGAKLSAGDSPARMFAQAWYLFTKRSVPVIAFDCAVSGGLFCGHVFVPGHDSDTSSEAAEVQPSCSGHRISLCFTPDEGYKQISSQPLPCARPTQ